MNVDCVCLPTCAFVKNQKDCDCGCGCTEDEKDEEE